MKLTKQDKKGTKVEHLICNLLHQVYLGSYDWSNADKLMLSAAKVIKKQKAELKKLRSII